METNNTIWDGPKAPDMRKKEKCDRCKKFFIPVGLKNKVVSTRHNYKGRIDNPSIFCGVTFCKVSDGSVAFLCKKCRKKTIQEMYNGGNWA